MVYVVSITEESRETKWCPSWNLELRHRVYPRVEQMHLALSVMALATQTVQVFPPA